MDERNLIARLRAENATLREQVRQFEEILAPSSIAVSLEWGLTKSERRVYACPACRDQASQTAIMQALYSDRPGDPPTTNTVHSFVCRLRKKLAPFGIAITTIWAEGYRLHEPRCGYLAERLIEQ